MEAFETRLSNISKHDEEKAAFIADLLDHVRVLSDEKSKIQEQLDLSHYLCQKQVEDLKSIKQQVTGMHRSMNCDPFVLVLIDGDITTFSDDYVQRGSLGGHDAARDLRKAIYEYFESQDAEFLVNTKIIIHVFANIMGLSRTYHEVKIVPDLMVFRQFVQGFNKEHALCHFTDAGDDKEAADNKVKAQVELFFDNVHCKHIMLAASGDNSYAGFLRQYSLTDQVSSRVVLIESIPFASQLEELASKFQTTRMKGLFRECKVERRRTSFLEENKTQPQKSPTATYASTVKQKNGAQDKPAVIMVAYPTAEISPSKQGKKIFQNSKGQRVDQQIKADRATVTRLKPMKLCNRYFLTQCHYGACTHSHVGSLTPVELDALRFIARLSPCQTVYCEDPDCVAGHRCMQGSNCDRRGSKCWFDEEMHDVDAKIAGFITV